WQCRDAPMCVYICSAKTSLTCKNRNQQHKELLALETLSVCSIWCFTRALVLIHEGNIEHSFAGRCFILQKAVVVTLVLGYS
ncbi:hypothetical protein MTR67_039501, partial [Solanum verrucosum]